jgi:hypothetical protein
MENIEELLVAQVTALVRATAHAVADSEGEPEEFSRVEANLWRVLRDHSKAKFAEDILVASTTA